MAALADASVSAVRLAPSSSRDAKTIAVTSAAMALSNVQDLDDYWSAFAVALRL